MHIARNRLWNGGTTHWGISWKQCIYEDNEATGVSTTAFGSNYPQYAHNDGAPHVQNIYHFNNTQNQVWGNDRKPSIALVLLLHLLLPGLTFHRCCLFSASQAR